MQRKPRKEIVLSKKRKLRQREEKIRYQLKEKRQEEEAKARVVEKLSVKKKNIILGSDIKKLT